MSHRKSKKPKHPFAKGTTIGVRLGDLEEKDLIECARRESQARGQVVHEATLLRDLGMPRVRERLIELGGEPVSGPQPVASTV